MTDSGRTTAFIAGLVIFAGGAAAFAQERGGDPGRRVVIEQAPLGLRVSTGLNGGVDPLAGPPVAGAPFSGEASTTVTQTLGDGTHIEQRTVAKLYRDSTGRVRREQTIIGLDRLNPATQSQTVISFDSVPGDPMPYILDPEARVATRTNRVAGFYAASGQLTAYRISAAGAAEARELERASNLLASGGLTVSATAATIPADIRPTEEDLGTRQMDGVRVTGRRTTTVIPAGRIGNDAPIRITDERWQSPELNVTVYSRFSDPRTGVVEYRLTGVTRTEPRPDLFTVPSDYTIRETQTFTVGGPRGAGQRGTPAGRGGRVGQ